MLATVPLAADGSFYVEDHADLLIDVQALDSDRRTGDSTSEGLARSQALESAHEGR